MLIAPFSGRRENQLYQASVREDDVFLRRMHPTSTKFSPSM
jgi:hypothetical protein